MHEQEAAVCLVGALGLLGSSAACQPVGRQTGAQDTAVPSSGPAQGVTGAAAPGDRPVPDASVAGAPAVADAGPAAEGGPGPIQAGPALAWPAPGPGALAAEAGVSSWRFQMKGYLDAAKGSCQGTAKVHATTEEGRFCYAWRLERVTCTGSREVDWLNEGGTAIEAQLCYGHGDWGTTDRVPGRGHCLGTLRPRGTGAHVPPREIALECSWLCRGDPPGCVGEAQYTLTKLPPE